MSVAKPSDWIFSDLDGTLLRLDKSISDFTLQTLTAVKAQGHRIAFVTARPPRAVRRLLPPALHDEWMLCYNGAKIAKGTSVLAEATIAWQVVENGLNTLTAEFPDLVFGFESGDNLITNGDFAKHSTGDVYTVKTDWRGVGVDVNKVLVLVPPQVDGSRLAAAFGGGLSTVVTDQGTLLQVMPAGVSKGDAVRRLLAAEQSGGESLCFGDDLNDISLFSACTWPVALENSVQVLKDLARDFTASNENDGVARYLHKKYGAGAP